MKKVVILVLLCILMACQEKSKKQVVEDEQSMVPQKQEMSLKQYPEDFAKLLKVHGGIDQWRKGKTLKFTIGNPGDTEKYIVDLNRRMDKIITSDYDMGYDGNETWVMNKKGKYKGNAAFMHDLMFYFYAMPFVLADPGVNYVKTEDKEIMGKSYHGIKVTFESGIGASSSDEYYLYYDPETYKMSWLAYKATFGSDEKPEQPNYISYDKWDNVGGLLLPTSIAWYAVAQGQVKEEKNRVDFNNISISEEVQPNNFYSKPANAMVVEDKKQ